MRRALVILALMVMVGCGGKLSHPPEVKHVADGSYNTVIGIGAEVPQGDCNICIGDDTCKNLGRRTCAVELTPFISKSVVLDFHDLETSIKPALETQRDKCSARCGDDWVDGSWAAEYLLFGKYARRMKQ